MCRIRHCSPCREAARHPALAQITPSRSQLWRTHNVIRDLVQAAEPLEGKFNGAGKATFDSFKLRADEITSDLNGALSSILGGQAGMDTAFGSGDQEQSDNAHQNMGAANFDGARFSA